MLYFHKLLYKRNKLNFIITILLELIISILNVALSISFFNENTGMSSIILLVVLQVINIGFYNIFKLYYKKELFDDADNIINTFSTEKNAQFKDTMNKISQVLIFFVYQMVFTGIAALVLNISSEVVKVISINYIISLSIFLFLSINKFTILLKYKKEFLDGIFVKFIIVGLIGLSYAQSYILIYLVIMGLILSIGENLYLIKRGIHR